MLGTFITIYSIFIGKRALQIALESYSVRNYQNYADRTSEYTQHNEEIARIEDMVNIRCGDHERHNTELSFTQEDKNESNLDKEALGDFRKNIEYYGSMDHFIQLEYENSLMRKTIIQLQDN